MSHIPWTYPLAGCRLCQIKSILLRVYCIFLLLQMALYSTPILLTSTSIV